MSEKRSKEDIKTNGWNSWHLPEDYEWDVPQPNPSYNRGFSVAWGAMEERIKHIRNHVGKVDNNKLIEMMNEAYK